MLNWIGKQVSTTLANADTPMLTPNAVAPNAGVACAPNVEVDAPKAGAGLAPKAGAGLAPNAGCVCRGGALG